MGKIIFVTIYVFLALFASEGESLTCYGCSSTVDPTCANPAQYPSSTKVTCIPQQPVLGMQSACVTRQDTEDTGLDIVTRGCALIPANYNGHTCFVNPIGLLDNPPYCDYCTAPDLCNNANIPLS